MEKATQPSKPPKFSAYQNPALSAVLTENSLRPSKSILLFIFSAFSASAVALFNTIHKEEGFTYVQLVIGVVFVSTLSALIRVIISLRKKVVGVPNASKGDKDQRQLTERQLGLLGIKPKPLLRIDSDIAKKPPKSKPCPSTSSKDTLFPIHQHSVTSPNRSFWIGSGNWNVSGGSNMGSHYMSSKLPGLASSQYLLPSASSVKTSPGLDRVVSSPWSKQRSVGGKDIVTEEMLEEFLADTDEKITASAEKQATPPPTINTFGVASPGTLATSGNTSGTKRSTPLRPVRMSPTSQKFSTPPKKGEADHLSAMSIEESIKAFEHLGIYPQIEHWRDRLRQWFSAVLLNPLLNKIETSHIQVMQVAAKLNISITVNQVGSDSTTIVAPVQVSPVDGTKEWQSTLVPDEDGLLHQLHANLVAALDLPASKLSLGNMFQAQPMQQNPLLPVMQECLDAITEHQRLRALMKGEWVKGLLPQSSVRADYTVQRIRELAEGTCLKNYEYLGTGEVYDKVNKKWTLELPTDSHLLLYLFCAFLEHPKWMLHVDPTLYVSAQSRKNPLFLGVLPPKERFPEKYVAVISGVPSVLHPGACILAVGKQSPPLFALYWEKKLQFSLQGRTALWDAILLLCHRIRLEYGGVVGGVHLGSSAFSILPVIDSESED